MSSKEPAGHLADDEHLSVLGYEGKFDRSMSLWANFALGFTYLSPLVGVYSLLAVALATGGPPSIWWIVIVAILAFISCVLSLQAAASRLLYSFARDGMLPGHTWLSKVSERSKVPTNALIVACTVPALICVLIFINENILVPVTSFAILGIYLAFQMVVFASLKQRFQGWKPAGPFSLGGLGIVVNVLALAYGVFAMILLATPGVSGDFFTDYVVLIGLAVVLVTGLIYLFVARPDSKSNAPEGDARAVADEIRHRTGAIKVK